MDGALVHHQDVPQVQDRGQGGAGLPQTPPEPVITGFSAAEVEDFSEELLAPAILCRKEPARASEDSYKGFQSAGDTLVLYGIRAPIIDPFHAWNPTILRS